MNYKNEFDDQIDTKDASKYLSKYQADFTLIQNDIEFKTSNDFRTHKENTIILNYLKTLDLNGNVSNQINDNDIELEVNDFSDYGFYKIFKIKKKSKYSYIFLQLKKFNNKKNLINECVDKMLKKYKNGLYIPYKNP